MRSATIIAGFLLFFIVESGFSSEIYQWIDDKGIVHFSNEAPPANARIIRQWKETKPGNLPDDQSDPEVVKDQGQSLEKESDGSGISFTGKIPDEKKVEIDSSKKEDSEDVLRLKQNLKIRTSTDKQRKLKRRINALESKESGEPKPAD